MQQSCEMPDLQKGPSASREAMRLATQKMGRGQGLVSLLLSLLLGMMTVFAAYLFASVLVQVLIGYTSLTVRSLLVIYYVATVCFLLPTAIPLFVGRIRMAGLVAIGREGSLCEALYYYASPRLLMRAMGIGVLWVLSVISLPAFGAVALAVADDDLPLFSALCLACKRGIHHAGAIFKFWLCTLWHLLLSVLTLGVLWLLYYAHHTTVAYFELTMMITDDPKGELQ